LEIIAIIIGVYNPDNHGGVQDKTSFNWGGVGRWDDDADRATYPFICRVEASGKLPPSGKLLIHQQLFVS